jgi:hypothetical protein
VAYDNISKYLVLYETLLLWEVTVYDLFFLTDALYDLHVFFNDVLLENFNFSATSLAIREDYVWPCLLFLLKIIL